MGKYYLPKQAYFFQKISKKAIEIKYIYSDNGVISTKRMGVWD